MLKSVAISDVELGMFVHKMEGNWFDHPFWKGRFLLDDHSRLDKLKSSGLESVVIDTSKGKDCASAPAAPELHEPGAVSLLSKYRDPEVRRPASRVSALSSRASVGLQSTEPLSTKAEMGNAQIIADKAQKEVAKVFLDARLGNALDMSSVEPVVKDIFASVQRNAQAFSGLMRCKLNNEFIYRHALSVSALMVSLACQMKLTPNEIREAGLAGLFLDIGTNYFPKELTPSNGDYRNADAEIWQQHVMLGVNALEGDGNISAPVIEACLQHHERVDGGGFPHGLEGPAIGRLARMAALCDAFDYLLTDNTASQKLDPASAIVKLQEMEGAFDSEILRLFIESVGIHPIGSFVRLSSGLLAMVIDEHPREPAKPVVRTFYSLARDQRIGGKTIELARCPSKDEIVGLADLSGLALPEEGQLRELIFLGAYQAG